MTFGSFEFPSSRPRRLRKSAVVRNIASETTIAPGNLMLPLFVKEGIAASEPIPSLFTQAWHPVEGLPEIVGEAVAEGIRSIILFGVPCKKDSIGSGAYGRDGIVQKAVRAIRENVGRDIAVFTDVCMCQYTDHGHCGIVTSRGGRQQVDNDKTLEYLQKISVSHAEAGADFVAPSGMMDGMVRAIRSSLDDAGHEDIGILSYAVKYASSFYGPFREAASSCPSFGDRRTHQMDPRNAREALKEVALDLREGADIVMVKPALAYLDVLKLVRDSFPVPIAAYNVSGEYAMVEAAAKAGLIDEKGTVFEILLSLRRAGADMILTYHALDAARWLREA